MNFDPKDYWEDDFKSDLIERLGDLNDTLEKIYKFISRGYVEGNDD